MKNKGIIINSSILFVIATIIQMTLHEGGHFITAIILHSNNVTLFHNYVQHDSSSLLLVNKILIAAAGPLFSLLIGMGFHLVCSIYTKRNSLFLFFLYLSVFGYINFFGYLIVGPIFVGGDTGYIFHVLEFPIWITISIAVLGGVSLFIILKMQCKFFIEMGSAEIIENLSLRKQFVNSLLKYPLYIGIIVTTLLNLPVPVFLSLIYPLCSPFALMWVYGFLLENKYSGEKANASIIQFDKVQPVLLFFLTLVIILNRYLVFGFHIN